jgi:hypothetical protein
VSGWGVEADDRTHRGIVAKSTRAYEGEGPVIAIFCVRTTWTTPISAELLVPIISS